MATPTAIVGYLALFAAIGFLFLFVNLVVGRLVRPSDPHDEKLEIYECGEPTIGSSFVQFDLRYYVVALVFLVFDIEVAFLFPLATVYGKAVQLADERLAVAVATDDSQGTAFSADARFFADARNLEHAQHLHRELGVVPPNTATAAAVQGAAHELARVTMLAILVFFVILLVGFAYEWKTGAFDWVRVLHQERAEQFQRPPPAESRQPVAISQ